MELVEIPLDDFIIWIC